MTYFIFTAAPHIAEPTAKKSSPPSSMGLLPNTFASPPDLDTMETIRIVSKTHPNDRRAYQGMTAVALMLYALPIQVKSRDFSELAMVGSAVLMASWG